MRKSIVLVTVIGLMFVIFSLTFAALYLMTQEAQIAERKIRNMRLFYAAQAGVVHALELLRGGSDPSGVINIGNGIAGYPTGGLPVTITVSSGAGVNGTDEVIVTTNY